MLLESRRPSPWRGDAAHLARQEGAIASRLTRSLGYIEIRRVKYVNQAILRIDRICVRVRGNPIGSQLPTAKPQQANQWLGDLRQGWCPALFIP